MNVINNGFTTLNWFKPSRGVLLITYRHGAETVYLIDCNIIEQNPARPK